MRMIVAGILAFSMVACATIPKRVIRDTQTYTVEILAGLQREKDAAAALFEAADAARDAGHEEACRLYVHPALVIQVKSQPQAYRALWLAGLPYPNPDGSLPDPKEKQPDPGAASSLQEDAAVAYCLTDDPEVDPPGLEVEHGGDNE
tara:strand:+ start:3103 stop:3543 length:441 start_codon:yes stop_codon:yes gene_type:complete